MGYYHHDIVGQASDFGFELIGELELSNNDYEFDLLAVLRDVETGEYWGTSDRGCSCPSPWEDHVDRSYAEQLGSAHTAVDWVQRHVKNSRGRSYTEGPDDPADLIARIMRG